MTDHGTSSAAGGLPLPAALRWKPLRGGLLNLYRFDRQEFRYEDGRLLLRGNNGSGKSRVLALQLPFLLDGEITPTRVEPDQDPAKRMEWNLLMGGKYDDRLGYSWLEFGRVDEDGHPHYHTIGCGLRAVQGRGVAQQWFFITTRRMGEELRLENELGQPLTKAKLEESLGQDGRIFSSGRLDDDRRDYRRAVDAALFGLGERYEALLDLLIQLRQPQLSRKLNEEALSDALSLALPPLPAQVLEDVAEAFRSLETDRQELADLTAASASSAKFLVEYRRYIQIAARRRAEEVRRAHSAYEGTMRKLREAEERGGIAAAEAGRWRVESERLAQEAQQAAAEERTLRDSPEMKSVNELENARQEAGRGEDAAGAAVVDCDLAQAALARAEGDLQSAATAAERAKHNAEDHAASAGELAGRCGMEDAHRAALVPADGLGGEPDRVALTRQSLEKSVRWKLEGIAHVEQLTGALAHARQHVTQAQQARDRVEGELGESVEAERRALSDRERQTETFFAGYREWAGQLDELSMPDLESLEVPFLEWRDSDQLAAGDNPIADCVKESGRAATQRIAAEFTQTEVKRDQMLEVRAERQAEYRRLAEGRESPPPAPPTRDGAQRDRRAGAPFWALCDFHPSLSEMEQAGLEAALEASGLLDAWVLPEGRLILPDDRDSFVVARAVVSGAGDSRLDRALRPEVSPESPVPARVVDEILRSLGLGQGAGECWVDAVGAWQLGPLHGRWSKPAAQYIGQASREAERQRRMNDLQREIQEIDSALARFEEALEALNIRRARLRKEIDGAPTDHLIRQAQSRIQAAQEAVSSKRHRLMEAEAALAEKLGLHKSAAQKRDESAQDFKIETWVERLPDLKDTVQEYRLALAELWPAMIGHAEATHQQAQAAERQRAARRTRDEREARRQEVQGLAAAARARHQTLEDTIGRTAGEVRAKLQHAVARAGDIARQQGAAAEFLKNSDIAIAVAQNDAGREREELERHDLQRRACVAGLVGFAGTGQLRVAHDRLDAAQAGSWSVTRVVELAREIESLLEQVDHSDAAWKRNQREIHQHFEDLQSSLRSHGYLPEGSISDEVFVVTVPHQGRSCTVAELRDGLTADIQERRQLLDAREREVLENYLIDEVANHLHDLLHRALRWCEEANQELQSRPMHTGMTLRFTWEPSPEAPPALAEARRLLLGARGTWSPAQRKAVGEFLQQRIRAVQTENEAGTWQNHLADAFDYRKWHRFSVERKQDGQWKRLTRRTHGTGSGGEKAIALTLPQLAAAAAHYRSASPLAPRLILLDEAFVGVDKDMRAKCLDLLCAFDLDVVMTSESEWACYPTVPAIAIYQLSARAGIDAVYASRWVWNGRQRVRDESADSF